MTHLNSLKRIVRDVVNDCQLTDGEVMKYIDENTDAVSYFLKERLINKLSEAMQQYEQSVHSETRCQKGEITPTSGKAQARSGTTVGQFAA